jgi:hypothetical protein
VVKTTIYLPNELKQAVVREAHRRGLSEAEVIRDAVRTVVSPQRERPTAGLYSGEPIAEHVDELLEGFGER